MADTFVLYDRETQSMWYPGEGNALNAISGPRKGDTIPVATESKIVPFDQWFAEHPDSKILLPPPWSKTISELVEDDI